MITLSAIDTHTHTHTHILVNSSGPRSSEDNGLEGYLAYTHKQDSDQIWIKTRPAGMIDRTMWERASNE